MSATGTIETAWLEPDHLQANLDALRGHFSFDPRIAAWAEEYERGHREHYASTIAMVRRAADRMQGRRVLEIGGVPGHVSALLGKTGFDLTVADIAPERAAPLFDSLGIPFHRVDVEREPLPADDNSRDLVVFCEVLEHLRVNPLFALREIARVLAPGGYCLLSTPQITPLMRWDFLRGRSYQGNLVDEMAKLEALGHMGHIRLYDRHEVVAMARHVGLQPWIESTGGNPTGQGRGFVGGLFRTLFRRSMVAQRYILFRHAGASEREPG